MNQQFLVDYGIIKRHFISIVRKSALRSGAAQDDLMHVIAQGLLDDGFDPLTFQDQIQRFLSDIDLGAVDPFSGDPITGSPEKGVQLAKDDSAVLIDQLISATRLYQTSSELKALADFIIRLRGFAPFNAMLLHMQKPGLTHAATAWDWYKRFGRVPKEGARPLLVLRTMGPVDFVFDMLDTEGRELPVDAFAFPTFGDLSEERFAEMMRAVKKERIDLVVLDAGDGRAGWIRLLIRANAKKGKNVYQLAYNYNHPPATRFVTLAHELAHLFLGHLGEDGGRNVPDRSQTSNAVREVEAEMAAYLVSKRNGLSPRSETYLTTYEHELDRLNLHVVMRAVNAVETAMGIGAKHLWEQKDDEHGG